MSYVFITIIMILVVIYAVVEGFLLGRVEGIVKKVEEKDDKIFVYMIARNGKWVVMTFEQPVKKLGGGFDLDEIRKLDLIGKRCVAHLIKQNRVDKFYIIQKNGEKLEVPKIKNS
jgi:hypothetical protein